MSVRYEDLSDQDQRQLKGQVKMYKREGYEVPRIAYLVDKDEATVRMILDEAGMS